MTTIRKTKYQCNICHDGIKIKYHKHNLSYYYCDRCNLIFVFDKNLDKFVRSYEPRKINNL